MAARKIGILNEEQIKLLAPYLNTLASGLIIAGVIAPVAAIVIQAPRNPYAIEWYSAGAIVLSVFLHLVAQIILGVL